MKTSLALLAALTLAIAAPAQAQEETAASPSQTPDASVLTPGGRSVTAFDRNARSGIGGYYDIEFNQPLGGAPSTFDLHHLILQASGQLHDNLFFNSEIEFEHGGVINDGTNDGELRIEQAWADYVISDALGLRAGVVLIPFGIVNVLHDSDIREATTRPLMARLVVPTTWMDSGVGLHGLFYPTSDMRLSYEAYVTNGLSDDITADEGMHEALGSLATDNNGNKAVSARVAVSPWLGLEVGLDGYVGAYDATGTKLLNMLGADLGWTAGPFEVVGEFANVATAGGTHTSGSKIEAIPMGLRGYYVEGRYHFFPEFLQGTFLGKGGGFDQATFTAFGRYGGADTDLAAAGATDKNEAVIGLNYRPVQTFVTKLEYQRVMDGSGRNDDAIWSSVAVGF